MAEDLREKIAAMLAEGRDPKDIVSELRPYKLTRYGEKPAPADLGPSTPANQRATGKAIEKEGDFLGNLKNDVVDHEWFPSVQESDYGYAPGATDAQKARSSPHGDPARGEATSDPIATMALSGALGAGAGAATAGAGRIVSGMANGVTGAVTAGSRDPMDILTAGILGVAGTRAGEPEVAPPQTQRDIDSVGLARAGNARMTLGGPKGGVFDGPEYQALPEGEHGTNVLADRVMQTADTALETRGARSQAALDAGEKDFLARHAGRRDDSTPLLDEFQQIRNQKMDRAGPLMPDADRRLRFYMDHARGGPEGQIDGRPWTTPEELNNLRKTANDRLKNLPGTDMSRAGDEQAAGVLSRAVRRYDEGHSIPDTGGIPRQIGPEMTGQETVRIDPNELQTGYRPRRFGDDLDAYAAEQKAIGEARSTLGEGAAARNRIARVGTEDQSSGAAAIGDARQVERAGEQIPEAMPFIDQIRARNIAKRRGDLTPPNLHGGALRMGAQFVRHNLDNARFRLNPPKAVVDLDHVPLEPDMLGSIPTDNAPWGVEKPSRPQLRADQLVPLELQLLLMQQNQQEER